MIMTMEEKLTRLKENFSKAEKTNDIIFICEDEKAHKTYFSTINTWKNTKSLLRPVTYSSQIATIGNSNSKHPSIIFFSGYFLRSDNFLKEVLKTLKFWNYDSEKIKIELYKIV